MGQNGCHGNAGCLETGQLILNYMASYFMNINVNGRPSRHTNSTRSPGFVTQFWGKWAKGQGHTGT